CAGSIVRLLWAGTSMADSDNADATLRKSDLIGIGLLLFVCMTHAGDRVRLTPPRHVPSTRPNSVGLLTFWPLALRPPSGTLTSMRFRAALALFLPACL